jgi:tetratricopeptide (TPR) repeat protein
MEPFAMRRLNVKLFLGLVGGTLFLAILVVVVHQLQAGNISSALLWQAEQAEKQGRLRDAARFLKRYLEFAPDDIEERARLGRLLADPTLAVNNRTRQRARFVIEQVLTREPERHDLRQILVRLALDSWQLDVAREHLGQLQKKLPGNPDVLGLVGQLQEKEEQTDQALQTYRKALAAGATDMVVPVRLIGLLLGLERMQPGSQTKEITGLVAAAYQKAPGDVGVLLAAAEWAFYQGDLKTGRARLEAGLKAHAEEPRLYQALASLAARTGKREEAVKLARSGLRAVPPDNRYELLWTLANLLIDGGDVAETRKTAGQIQDYTGPTPSVDYLEARCLMAQERWLEAVGMLERVRGSLKVPSLQVQIDLLLGKCYEQLHEPAQQLAAFGRVLARDPSSVAAREGAASAQWALGQADEAIKQQREILKLKGAGAGQAGRLELARLLLLSNTQKDPRRWQQVEAELDAAEKAQPTEVEAILLRAELRLAQEQPAEAEKVLRDALGRQPKSLPLWGALAILAEQRGDLPGARQVLDEAEHKVGDGVDLRLARARFWSARPKEEATPALLKLESGSAFAAADQARLLQGLGEAHYRLGNVPEAVRLWKQLAARPDFAKDLRVRMLLFDVAIRQGDEPAMRQLLKEIKSLDDSDAVLWRYGEAARLMWLARQGKKEGLDQARAFLEAVTTQRPTWPPGLLARAELEAMQGRPTEAIGRYRQALDKGVRDPRVVRQLVELLSAQQRYGEAEQVLRQLGQQAPLSADLQRLAVVLSLRNDDFSRAEDLVRQSTSAQSNDYRDQLWLGQVLAAGQRQSAEAEKALRRAVQLADNVPETWVALVGFLVDAGKAELAKEEIEKARAKLPAADAPLALAQCYEMVGALDKAREQCKAILQARSGDAAVLRSVAAFHLRAGDLAEAEPLLRQILDRKVKAAEEDATWARRTLALALAGGRDPRRLGEALALVGLRLDSQGRPAAGLAAGVDTSRAEDLARARVLATQNRQPFQARAAACLEEAARQQPLGPDDRLLLAQLYLARGDGDLWWGKARDQLKELIAAHGRNPTFLALYARALLEHGSPHEAEPLIDKLEQVEKARQLATGTLGSVELRARSLAGSGRSKQAVALLQAYAHQPSAPPERLLVLAGLYSRLGDPATALDVCAEARAKCAPEAVGGAGVAVVRAARQAEKSAEPSTRLREQAGRLEGWLTEGIKAQPEKAAVLRLQLADLLDLLGRAAEAEPVYRQVLVQDDRNPVALNNLAWLLARRPEKADEALKLINRAVELYGPQAELLDTRAVVYLALGRTQPAIADLNTAVADAPSPASYFHLVRAHHEAKDNRSALAVLSQANAAGLTAERLHPSERDTYRRVLADLKQR